MNVNFWAVLASAVASIVIGGIWYGPLFGKQFMKATGMDKMSAERKKAMKERAVINYLSQFIVSVIMFYVLAVFVAGLGLATVGGGLMVAFWIWIGFVVPIKLGDLIWGGDSILFCLNIGNMLVTLIAAGAIIGWWK